MGYWRDGWNVGWGERVKASDNWEEDAAFGVEGD